MNDVLFPSEIETFKIGDLFSSAQLSNSLNRLPTAPGLASTPKVIYEQIKTIAKVRFGHDLPEIKKLTCLGSVAMKTSFLRDVCKAVGIQVTSKKEFLLANNLKQVLAHHNQAIEEAHPKGKKVKPVLLSE